MALLAFLGRLGRLHEVFFGRRTRSAGFTHLLAATGFDALLFGVDVSVESGLFHVSTSSV